jgi:hypothetical protein
MAHEFKLQPSSEQQLKFCPNHKWSAHCGVFRSEEDFIQFLRYYYAPTYGECVYKGTTTNPDYFEPIRIPAVNYTVSSKSTVNIKELDGSDLRTGTMAVILNGSHAGELVVKGPYNVLQGISDGTAQWTTPEELKALRVRLLDKDEVFEIRGQ